LITFIIISPLSNFLRHIHIQKTENQVPRNTKNPVPNTKFTLIPPVQTLKVQIKMNKLGKDGGIKRNFMSVLHNTPLQNLKKMTLMMIVNISKNHCQILLPIDIKRRNPSIYFL